MHQSSAFWPLLLLVPLVLLGLTGCVSPCADSVGPDLDPDVVSANGLIYLNSPASHSLYAIEMKTGSIRWNHQAAGTVLVDSGILYIDDEISMIYAFDASDGTRLWQKKAREGSHLTRLFAAADHLAYLTKDDSTLEAVNGRDGSLLWQQVLKPNPTHVSTDAPATLQETSGVVYLSTMNFSSVFAFRERDGALLWQFNTTPGSGLNSLQSTVFGDEMIFLSADQTYALRMSDGKLLWSSTHTGSLLEANGVLYLNTSASPTSSNQTSAAGASNALFAFGASDGRQLWHRSFTPTSPAGTPETYAMQLSGQQVYLFPAVSWYRPPASAFLFAFRASDGTPLWKETLPARKFSLVALQGVLYLFSGVDRYFDSGLLEALRETDGTVLWSQSTQEAGIVVNSNAIYLGIGGNTEACAPKSMAQIEKLQASDAALIWQRQLDPALDPLLFVESLLSILGGLLSLLGLLLFLLSNGKQAKRQRPSPPSGNPARVILSASSMSRIDPKAWLLLALLGLVLLLVTGLLKTRGIY